MISPWTNRQVDVDPYGPNPMLEALKVEQPGVWKAATAGGPAPRMFAAGDLPSFTASGVAPDELNRFSWNQRHDVAATASAAKVFELSEKYCDQPDYTFSSTGYQDFLMRMNRWARESGLDKTDGADDVYASLYGAAAK